MSILRKADFAKALLPGLQHVFGVEPVFDISEPRYAEIDPSLSAADTTALKDMWMIKFGEHTVLQHVLQEAQMEWKCIAHELWKRKEMDEYTLRHSPGGSEDFKKSPAFYEEKAYCPKWK